MAISRMLPTKFLANATRDLVPVQPTDSIPYEPSGDEGHVTRESRLGRNSTAYPQPTQNRLAAKYDYEPVTQPTLNRQARSKLRQNNKHPMLRTSKPGLTFSSSLVKKDAAAVVKEICQLSFPAKVLKELPIEKLLDRLYLINNMSWAQVRKDKALLAEAGMSTFTEENLAQVYDKSQKYADHIKECVKDKTRAYMVEHGFDEANICDADIDNNVESLLLTSQIDSNAKPLGRDTLLPSSE